jgi:hypothetical protein
MVSFRDASALDKDEAGIPSCQVLADAREHRERI